MAGFVKGVLSTEERVCPSQDFALITWLFSPLDMAVYSVSTHDLMFTGATWSLTKMLSGPEEPSHSATLSVKSNHSRNQDKHFPKL